MTARIGNLRASRDAWRRRARDSEEIRCSALIPGSRWPSTTSTRSLDHSGRRLVEGYMSVPPEPENRNVDRRRREHGLVASGLGSQIGHRAVDRPQRLKWHAPELLMQLRGKAALV